MPSGFQFACTQVELTWQKLVFWAVCFYSGADKGNPHVLGGDIMLV